jgi:hypothetical protein
MYAHACQPTSSVSQLVKTRSYCVDAFAEQMPAFAQWARGNNQLDVQPGGQWPDGVESFAEENATHVSASGQDALMAALDRDIDSYLQGLAVIFANKLVGFVPEHETSMLCAFLIQIQSDHVKQSQQCASESDILTDDVGPSLREPKSGERCCEHLHPSLSCGISPERAAGVDPDSLEYLSSGPMGVDPVHVEGLPALAPTVQILFCSEEHAFNFNVPLAVLNCNRCLPQAVEKYCLPCVTQKPMLSGARSKWPKEEAGYKFRGWDSEPQTTLGKKCTTAAHRIYNMLNCRRCHTRGPYMQVYSMRG